MFMDCDKYFCMDAEKLAKFCEEECEMRGQALINKKTGRRVRAIVAVHVFGNMADMEAIMNIAEKYDIKVLEDATEALGSYVTSGKYKGQKAGTIGDIGVYSFNANKIITTGGGGMIVSRNKKYLDEARYLTITAKETSTEEALHFVHNEVGYNYRMTNLQAALGVSQIDKLEAFIDVKERNFNKYSELLKDTAGLTLLPFTPNIRSNKWFYALYVDEKEFGEGRETLMYRLLDDGVQCRPVWKLTHTQQAYRAAQNYEIEKAYDYEKNVLNIPCSTNLTEDDVEYVCSMIKNIKE